MRLTSTLLLCALLFAGSMAAADIEFTEERGPGKLWWASVAAMVGSSALDAHSSYGKREMNPILASANGQFGGRGMALKAALAGAVAAAQYFMVRKNRRVSKYVAYTNFGISGILGGVAMHNYGNQRFSPAPAAQPRPDYLVAAQPAGAR